MSYSSSSIKPFGSSGSALSSTGSGISTNFIRSISPYSTTSSGSGSSTDDSGRSLSSGQEDIFDIMKNFSSTSKWGELFSAGTPYEGSLGNYDFTGEANPESLDLAKAELAKLFGDEYDPYNEGGVYSGFKAGVEREAADAQDTLKRNLAVTGDLYSTENARQSSLLAERTSQTLSDKLAELYDANANRRVQGISTAASVGAMEEGINADRRNMANQGAQAEYTAWQNQRGEFQSTLDIAQSLLNQRIDSGGSSSSTSSSGSTSTTDAANGTVQPASNGMPAVDWSDYTSVLAYKEAEKKKQNATNPSGWWKYDGAAAMAPVWGRQNDARPSSWNFG